MTREKNPVFRRAIIPWYDSDRVCWIVVGLMIAIAIFSAAGILAALEDPRFHNYFWLPLLLLLLSAGIAVSTLMRMMRRYIDRLSR
jgi:membrane protein required for beta-lactamase induction